MKKLIYCILLITLCSQSSFPQTREEVLDSLESVIRQYTQINNPGFLAFLEVNPDSVIYAYVEDFGDMRMVETTYVDLKNVIWSVDEDYNLVADRPAVFSLSVMQDSTDSSIYLPTSRDSLNGAYELGVRCDCRELNPYLAALFTWLKESSQNPDQIPYIDLKKAYLQKFKVSGELQQRERKRDLAEEIFNLTNRQALWSFLPFSRFSSFSILGLSVADENMESYLNEVLEKINEEIFNFPLKLSQRKVEKANQQLLYYLDKFLKNNYQLGGPVIYFSKKAFQNVGNKTQAPNTNHVLGRFIQSNLLFEIDYSDYEKISKSQFLNDITGGVILFSENEDWMMIEFSIGNTFYFDN
ncbi:hypothetical protein H3C65_03820 [Patescibacteria group bacterium]|nr:hypothetical protein [Patescibacteria group bacterium]